MSAPTPESHPTHGNSSAAEIRSWIVGELSKSLKVDASTVDPSAPLLSLGVDSLAAIGMSGGLASWLGRDVPATLLWDYPSIDAIADALAAQIDALAAPARPNGVVELQPHGSRSPVFCFPGLNAPAESFAFVAKYLGPTQPSYGLSIPELSDDGRPLTRIEEMAGVMQSRLRLVQPTGPYQLAGHSLGGLLAYEAAQQLTAAGQTVSTLAIYDTFTPAGRILRPRWQRLILRAYSLATRKDRLLRLKELVKYHLPASKTHRPAGNADRAPADAKNFEAVCRRAAETYQPQPYPGSIALFRATERAPYTLYFKLDPTNGWAALAAGGVRVTDLPGGHINLIDAAHAPAAAEALMRQLVD
jgi:thioesterase domain-containing protein/acyl carrier protein